MRVKDLMSMPPVTVRETDSAESVARRMLDAGVTCVVVTDATNHAVGQVTDRDFSAQDPNHPFEPDRPLRLFGKSIRREGFGQLYADIRNVPVKRIMRPVDITLQEDDPVEKAADLMARRERLNLVVLRGDRVVGVVRRLDMLKLVVGPHLVAA